MTRFFEFADRVIRIKMTPDTPGVCRRRLVIAVESGAELTEEEADRVSAALVAEIISQGGDMVRWLRS